MTLKCLDQSSGIGRPDSVKNIIEQLHINNFDLKCNHTVITQLCIILKKRLSNKRRIKYKVESLFGSEAQRQ